MPRSLRHPCVPGCPELLPPGTPRCPRHTSQQRAAVDDRRGSAASRGYGYHWDTKVRPIILSRPVIRADGVEVPPGICESCVDQLAVPVDHITSKARGGTDYFVSGPVDRRLNVKDNLQRLCHSCHNRKTAREDGGFGRAPRPARE